MAAAGFFGRGKLLDLSAAISDTQLGAIPVRKSPACSLHSGITSFAAAVDLRFVPGVSLLRRTDAAHVEATLRCFGVSQASIETSLALDLKDQLCNSEPTRPSQIRPIRLPIWKDYGDVGRG